MNIKYPGRLLFVAIASVGFLHVGAQNQVPTMAKFDLKNIVASSPEAAMLGRFGDIPISYYTGTADVSIPLYTIKESGIELPIVLRYHGSGIKVEDEATNVGLGWSLDPGGAIIQIINGKPDADDILTTSDSYNFLKTADPGYPVIKTPFTPRYTSRPNYGNGLFSQLCYIPAPDMDSYTTCFDLMEGMGQPDIYLYNFPGGYSGKFYINPEDGSIVFLDKKQDITFTREGWSGWIAKTMDGNTFYFETLETSYIAGDLSNAISHTFKLSRIVAHNGKEVDFSYQDGVYYSSSYSESFHTEYPEGMGGTTDNQVVKQYSTIIHYVKTLTGITGDNTIISFNLGSRQDMTLNNNGDPNVQKVNSVDIKNAVTGQVAKSYLFSYDYFTGIIDGSSFNGLVQPTDADMKRLKLLSVQEIGYNSSGQPSANPAYKFGYDETVPIPLKSSMARDFWGYYNGQPNQVMLPDLKFFFYTNDNLYNSSTIPPDLLSRFAGANRSPDSTKMKMGLLKAITYPTGGYTTFGYEPHIFGNHPYPDMQKILHTSQYASAFDQNLSNSNDTKSVSFTLSESQLVNFDLEFSRQSGSTSYSDMLGSTVTLSETVNGVTTVIRQWDLVPYGDLFNNNNGDVVIPASDAGVYLSFDPGAVYTLSVDLNDQLGPQSTIANNAIVNASFTYYTLPTDYNISYGGGMRVSSIENYAADGQVAGKKVIRYIKADNTTSGILMSPLRTLWSQVMSSLVDNGTGLGGQMFPVWNISSESNVPFSDGAQGNVVGYSRVEEVQLAPDNSTLGKHVYTYNNAANDFYLTLPDDPYPLNGMPNTEEIYDNSSTIPVQKTTYSYTSLQNTLFCGYKASPYYVGSMDIGCGSPLGQPSRFPYDRNFYINFYPIHGYWYLPSGKRIEKTQGGITMATTETYTYNSKGQMVRIDTYDSKQRKRSMLNLFPIDNPGDPMSSQLISQGLYNSLQQQQLLLDDVTELSKSYVYYRNDNGLAVQDHVTRSNRGATPYTETTFDQYLNYKTPYQVTGLSYPTCLLWSFNFTKPIAEIKNATVATVESILGATAIRNFAANPNPSISDINSFLAPLRSAPALNKAQVVSYTYIPQIGVATMTDVNGFTMTYEYDPFGRLQVIKDKDGNVIKTIDYHYKGQ